MLVIYNWDTDENVTNSTVMVNLNREDRLCAAFVDDTGSIHKSHSACIGCTR